MPIDNPLEKPREVYRELMAQLSSADSPVGIDVQYTHAIIIDYLQQISARLDDLEQRIADQPK